MPSCRQMEELLYEGGYELHADGRGCTLVNMRGYEIDFRTLDDAYEYIVANHPGYNGFAR